MLLEVNSIKYHSMSAIKQGKYRHALFENENYKVLAVQYNDYVITEYIVFKKGNEIERSMNLNLFPQKISSDSQGNKKAVISIEGKKEVFKFLLREERFFTLDEITDEKENFLKLKEVASDMNNTDLLEDCENIIANLSEYHNMIVEEEKRFANMKINKNWYI